MNIETGEIKKLMEEEYEKLDKSKWVSLELGEIVMIKGCRCKLTYINEGKKRLTFTAIGDG